MNQLVKRIESDIELKNRGFYIEYDFDQIIKYSEFLKEYQEELKQLEK